MVKQIKAPYRKVDLQVWEDERMARAFGRALDNVQGRPFYPTVNEIASWYGVPPSMLVRPSVSSVPLA